MYLGIDLGTSGVKALLLDDGGQVLATGTAALDVHRPYPLWSEQDPADWWKATCQATCSLPEALRAQVKGIGLSGQMHGAVLLGEGNKVLRPAILWNDGRSGRQCLDLEASCPDLTAITGNHAMPGFTAPKLLWVKAHEPEVFAATRKVLLPKDWLRLMMTGEAVSDMSDAAGTLWLDTGKRAWSPEALAACALTVDHMPSLKDGCQVAGFLTSKTAKAWGMPIGIPVAAGAGDNAASAIGMGVIASGQGLISLGTSGVIFVAAPHFKPNPSQGVHTFCHAMPDLWHWMSVILSAASAIDWAIAAVGFASMNAALEALEHNPPQEIPVFLPYLSGERTPHNDPKIKGAYVGLTHATSRTDMVRAVLEGVAFAFGDGFNTLKSVGEMPDSLLCVGGGSRIAPLLPILASVLNIPLHLCEGADNAAALGAARLGQLAATSAEPSTICTMPRVTKTIHPNANLIQDLALRRAIFRTLYPALKDITQ